MKHSPDKQIRPWTFAGIMLSYWCNARCRFCYVSCSPQAADWVEPAVAVRWWQELADLARSQGKNMRIHLSGGEPFGNWPVLLEIAQRAHEQGLTQDGAFQKVETNGFWATDPDIVRRRVGMLKDLGMQKLSVSADPHHQEFVDPVCVRTCVETARQVLGEDRVQVRWRDWYDSMTDLRGAPEPQVQQAMQKAYEVHPERLTGRASWNLAELLESRPVCRLGHQDCSQPLLAGKHVHIDPHGNVFPGVCAGIILGNALHTPIAEIYRQAIEKHDSNPVLSALVTAGPSLLLQYARVLGFDPRPAGYAGKCHLCMDVRRFLFDKRVFGNRLGPARVYERGSDTEATSG